MVKELIKRGHQPILSGSSPSYKGTDDMKVFVTGVGGQLGHDVVNELARRGHEGIGSDIQDSYSGISDGTAVTVVPYQTNHYL